MEIEISKLYESWSRNIWIGVNEKNKINADHT